MEVERVGGHLEALTLQVWVWVCVCVYMCAGTWARCTLGRCGDVAVGPQALEPKLPP